MEKIETEDIQGLIARGYGKLKSARFYLLKITDGAAAKNYLSGLMKNINIASDTAEDFAINVAFTAEGLRALGLPETSLCTFPREFLEGMTDEYRSFILGDQHDNDPQKWTWGGPNNDKVHLLLLLYALDDQTLEKKYNIQASSPGFAEGFSLIAAKETYNTKDNKEHFGFRDGITRIAIEGLRSEKIYEKGKPLPVKLGEFVLGYKNEYERYTDIPTAMAKDDTLNILPANAHNNELKDIGRNGSFLVYREMEQDVFGFWKYLEANSGKTSENKTEAAIKSGAKMFGRWPGGAPVVLYPDKENTDKPPATNFNYWKEDPKGINCPIGAHIRRSNPRDQLIDQNQNASIEMIRKHVIFRRGREFGKPLVESMDPADILKLEKDDGQKRGLHFICLNGNISRQFEFVQSIWINSAQFGGLYNDGDPIIGTRNYSTDSPNNEFTCPAMPLRTKYKNLPQFTTVVGGAYFFLPGMKALKFIAGS